MMRLLSIDPGTVTMGLAMWEGDRLEHISPFHLPERMNVEFRIGRMIETVAYNMAKWNLDAIAIERPFIDPTKPQPELQLLVKRLKQEAKKHKWGWYAYHPSTVLASVRPRGIRGWPSKVVLSEGVWALYHNLDWLDIEGLDQNVIDAIAVGHCHLSKMQEQQLTEDRELTP